MASVKPWLGKVIYSNEGITNYVEFETEAEAIAFKKARTFLQKYSEGE